MYDNNLSLLVSNTATSQTAAGSGPVITLQPSSASTSVSGLTQFYMPMYGLAAKIVLNGVSGSAGLITFAVYDSTDGTNFTSIRELGADFPSVGNSVGVFPLQFQTFCPYIQLRWAVSGTTPNFNFSAYLGEVLQQNC